MSMLLEKLNKYHPKSFSRRFVSPGFFCESNHDGSTIHIHQRLSVLSFLHSNEIDSNNYLMSLMSEIL
jgi:hypothetical protein